MRLSYSSEQIAFGESGADLFSKFCTSGAQRGLWSDETGRDPSLWRGLADLGVPAILVAEAYDGLGGTECDLLPILEEGGRQALPDALLESAFVGPFAIGCSGTEAQKRRWLPSIALGETRVAIALTEDSLVPDAHVSDLIVVARGGELWLYESSDVKLERVHSEDPSRRLFVVSAQGGGEPLPFSRERSAAIHAREHVGSAAVLNGVSAHLLDATVSYAKERQQFGRVIGSFQGVKHLLADAVSRVALATTATRTAAWHLGNGSVGATDMARLARVCAVEAEFVANKVALQVHGGIGFTFEHDLHRWLKRGKALEQVHGGHRLLARASGMHAVTQTV